MQAVTTTGQYGPILPGTGRVLIADDQEQVLIALEMLLRRYGFATESVTHPASVMRALQTEQFDAVLIDLNYTRDTIGGGEGLELVSQIRSHDRVLPIVVMTAWSSVDLAVEAMRRGAADFVQKPWNNQDLVQKLRDQLTLAYERRRTYQLGELEIEETRVVHDHALPRKLPAIPGYELAALTQPLHIVGGDYYNVVSVDARRTALCIADAAGKGLPAALLMSSLQAALRTLMEDNLAPRQLCTRLNGMLCDLTPVGKFISFFYAVLDHAEHRLTYCNAGHNPPWLMHRDGTGTELASTGAVLGQFPDWCFEQNEVQLNKGEILLLFTDGLVDACNEYEEPFSECKLGCIAGSNMTSSAKDLLHLLFGTGADHCGGRFQDDASLVVLKRK